MCKSLLAVLFILALTAPLRADPFIFDSYLVDFNPRPNDYQPDYQGWIRAEYLLWRPQAAPLPILVTTGGVSEGTLGAADTKILYGGQQNYGFISGARVISGLWFDSNATFGMESTYFQQSGFSKVFSTSSSSAILSIPTLPNVFPITNQTLPDPQTGSVQFGNEISFLGGDINFLCTPLRSEIVELNLLFGFQAMFLQENLTGSYHTSTPSLSTVQSTTDFFGTQNVFCGAQFGLRAAAHFGPLSLEGTAKLGVGSLLEIVNINGQQTTVQGAITTTTPTGLFAQASNSGHYNRNEFSIAPQAEIRLGWELTSHIKLSAGYDFVYLSNAVRPGNQIDQTVSAVNGVNHPVFDYHTAWFGAQGFNLGLEIRY